MANLYTAPHTSEDKALKYCLSGDTVSVPRKMSALYILSLLFSVSLASVLNRTRLEGGLEGEWELLL